MPSNLQIEGQIHNCIGYLLPLEDAQNKFLQIYFVGNIGKGLDRRQRVNNTMRRVFLGDLQEQIDEHNALVRLFKTAFQLMSSDEYKILIRADRRPAETHERQFNAPTIDEVAVVIVG